MELRKFEMTFKKSPRGRTLKWVRFYLENISDEHNHYRAFGAMLEVYPRAVLLSVHPVPIPMSPSAEIEACWAAFGVDLTPTR
jgi:hypothetical protein